MPERLYLVRHGVAGDRDARRWPDDDERPLTGAGKTRFREAALGLRAMDLGQVRIISSPVVRARQTAEILAEVLKVSHQVEFRDPLRYDARIAKTWELIRQLKGNAPVALLGHEPHLSQLISFLIAGDEHACNIDFKKGAVACLEADGPLQPGRLALRWLLTQKQLGRLQR